MENREYGSIVGSPTPRISTRLSRAMDWPRTTTQSRIRQQRTHQPSSQAPTLGVTTDGRYDLSANNLADQIDAAGKSWHVYEQDYPGDCSPAASAAGGVDLTGLAGFYFRKHNPAISSTDISGQPARCAAITSLAGFSSSAANFELIVPNTYNDMHSAPTATGDAFLNDFVPLIHELAGLRGQPFLLSPGTRAHRTQAAAGRLQRS